MIFPKKLIMIEQQKPYAKYTFSKKGASYDLTIERRTKTAYRFVTNPQFIKMVVDLKEKENFAVVEIVQ